MIDSFALYESGLSSLLERLGHEHPLYPNVLALQARLTENVTRTRQFGDTEIRRAERAQIIDALNRLALENLGTSFNELCQATVITPVQQIPQPTQVQDGQKVIYLGSTRNLPPLSKHFVGRRIEIESLKTQLRELPAFITLVGLGGIGKTSLAVAAIQELEGEGRFADGIFWLDGRLHADLGTLVMTLGGLLRLDLSQRTLTEQRQAVNYVLKGRATLVVLDNLESVTEPIAVIDFLRGLPCGVLITSRVRLPESENIFMVGSLSSDTALKLFADVSGNDLAMHDPDADALCNQYLEGHPLAIEMIAALAATGLSPAELCQYLRESPLDVLDISQGLVGMTSVVRALNMSYHRLTPIAQMVLTHASVFSAGFDLASLAALIPDQSRLVLAKAIQELEARSLLQSAGLARYQLHAVARQYAYGLLDERPVCHRRAAQYFLTERNDSLEAVRQLQRAGDEREAATLVPEHIERWIYTGRASEALAVLKDFDLDKMDPSMGADVYEARGDLQYLLGELDEAVHQYEKAIQIAALADAVTRARLHRKTADVLSRKGEYDEALTNLLSGRDLLADSDSDDGVDESAQLAVVYGTVLLALGLSDDAVTEAQTALNELQGASANPRIAADLHDLIGKVHFFRGDFAKSLEQFQSALELRKTCSDERGVIKSYSNLAVVYGEQNRYAEAQQASRAALEVAEQMGDTVALAILYTNMAADYVDQGAYDQAIDFHKRSLALYEKTGNVQKLSVAHHNLGDAYRRIGCFDLATEHLRQAIEFANQVADQSGVIGALEALAEVYLAQGHVEEALARCSESLQMAEDFNDQFWRPRNLWLLGRIHHAMRRWDEARTYFGKACQIWHEREAWLDLSGTILSWARLEKDAGQVNRACELSTEAAALADKYEADDLMQQASALLLELESMITPKEEAR